MTYPTTYTGITQKGQITIPKAIRDYLKFDVKKRITIKLDPVTQSVNLKATPDFFEVVKKIKRPKNPINVLKARELMEKNYERV